MVDLFDEPLRLVAAYKKLQGGSESTLVQCDDGNAYVVKTHPNSQGTNVLANEAIGAHLLRGLQIESPTCRAVLVTDGDFQRYAGLRREAYTSTYKPAAGLHFGSMHLGSIWNEITEKRTPLLRQRAINQDDFRAIYLFDLWAQHFDKRQYFYVIDSRSAQVTASFFDNGHLFGGPDWSRLSSVTDFSTRRWHEFPAGETSDLESMIGTLQEVVPGLLSEIFPLLPCAWYSGDLGSLERLLLFRLSILPDLVEEDYKEHAKAAVSANY